MSSIKILDCTLRDGGYVNDWNFGERTIKKIISKLSLSNIEIIECGFLTEKYFDRNKSLFNDVSELSEYIRPKNANSIYVGMIAYPGITSDKIPVYEGASIDGIRVTFHEKEIDEAIVLCQDLITKGYKVFVQPISTGNYKDTDLIALIEKVNNLMPYAFYMVDTCGVMYKNDLLRLFYLVDNNLNKSISIGFHSHNNLQLSFSNAQELLMLHTKRNIIIDSSVFGIGRGAGNLCTELITHYINTNISQRYDIEPLLEIIDDYISQIYLKFKWGYSIPYYIASINKCHPNYASFLMNKQTISVKSINSILQKIPDDKRTVYNEEYIENMYISYQKHYIDDTASLEKITKYINGRKVLILAPGKSIRKESEKINNFICKNEPFIISVNFISKEYKCDAAFISNSKRFEYVLDYLEEYHNLKIILTSNISVKDDERTSIVNYSDLLIDDPLISDNAGLMLVLLMKRLFICDIYFAGFDGFTESFRNNYFTEDMVNNVATQEIIKRNEAIKRKLYELSKFLNIYFITTSLYM